MLPDSEMISKEDSNEKFLFVVRDAGPNDCQSIHLLICELATYEKMLDDVEITVETLIEDGFGPGHEPRFRALIMERILNGNIDVNNQTNRIAVGFLLYIQKYSTFKGRFLWMEDLYVKPEYRRLGLGQTLVKTIVRKAHELRMPRIEWNVLAWNKLAIGFYEGKLGAFDMTGQEQWLTYRLNRDRFESILSEKTNPDNVDIIEQSNSTI